MILATLGDPPAWAVDTVYAVSRPGVEWLARRMFAIEITGREKLPERGPCVMASNHLSFIDPVITSMTARRNVRFLAVDFLFNRSVFFDNLILFFGAIPTPRDGPPIGAIRVALRHLDQGGVVGVYPEGRRVSAWGEEPPSRGAAWLSLATGAPVFPVALHGTAGTLGMVERRFRPTPIRVWIEDPLDPLDYTGYVDPTGAMMDDWREVMDARLRPWWNLGTRGEGAESSSKERAV